MRLQVLMVCGLSRVWPDGVVMVSHDSLMTWAAFSL